MFYTRTIAALLFIIICYGWMNPQVLDAQDWEAPTEADTLVNPLEHIEEVIEKGQQIYNNQCTMCHGETGKGDGPAGIALDPSPEDLNSEEIQDQSDGAIFWKIREGRGPMPGFNKSLDEEKLWSIVHYIRALSKEE